MANKKYDNSFLKKKEFGSFVKGFKKAADIIRMEKPDYIFAPIVGAVSFIDILSIMDNRFPLDSVYYLPNSSRFENRDELTSRWYSNFYKQNEIGEKMKIICIDEVLSGSSTVNGYKQFKKSIEERAKEKAKGMTDEIKAMEYNKMKLQKDVNYKILGIAEKGHVRNPKYSNLVNKKIIYPIEFDEVYTIDNIDLNPIRLKPGNRHKGRLSYLPEIEDFDITPKYMGFLQSIASYVGVDPINVSPKNVSRIEEGLKMASK
jgi:hypothetical protein